METSHRPQKYILVYDVQTIKWTIHESQDLKLLSCANIQKGRGTKSSKWCFKLKIKVIQDHFTVEVKWTVHVLPLKMGRVEICMGQIFQTGLGLARSKEKNFGPGPKEKLKFRSELGSIRNKIQNFVLGGARPIFFSDFGPDRKSLSDFNFSHDDLFFCNLLKQPI